jgi:hypothetical protein
MTAEEMSYEFDVLYDKVTNFDAPGYQPREKSTFLTKAQEQLVVSIEQGNAYNENRNRIMDVLKTTGDLSAFTAGPYANSFWADTPAVISIENESATLTPTSNHFYFGQTFAEVRVKPVDDDYYHLNLINPFEKPDHKKIWRMSYGEDDSGWKSKLVYIIPADMTLTGVKVHYFRKPSPIIIPDANYSAGETIDGVDLTGYTATGLDSELNEIIHREIVDRAVKLAYKALQDEKGFQLSAADEQSK